MVASVAAELGAAAAASKTTLDFPDAWHSFVAEAVVAGEFLAVAESAASAALQFHAAFAAAPNRWLQNATDGTGPREDFLEEALGP